MKAIVIVIKPIWVAKILNEKKTIEIRKTMPKCDLPIDVYICCAKGNNSRYNSELLRKYEDVYLVDTIDYKTDKPFLNGKVVAKFTLNKLEEITCRKIWGEWESYTKTLGYSEISQASCLENIEIVHYLKGKKGYAWYIDNLVIFDKPKELSEFGHVNDDEERCAKCLYWVHDNYPEYFEEYCCFGKDFCPLTKAPTSWCYVEV